MRNTAHTTHDNLGGTMDPKDPNSYQASLQWLQTLFYSGLSAFGGAVGYIMRTIENGKKINYARVALEGGAAGFVGVLVTLLCTALHLSAEWTGVVVGVSGWVGANGSIRLLEKAINKRLGLDGSSSNEP